MKKFYFLLCTTVFTCITVFSQRANLFTIPNQSASFIRMPSRGASTEIDAVFYNPAGTPLLGKGAFFSVNNQMLSQKTKVTSKYEYFNEDEKVYEGAVSSFIFPNFYGMYNTGKFSFHGGFFLIGGTGGAEYDNLPLSDRGISDIPAALSIAPFGVSLIELDERQENLNGVDPMYRSISDYRFNFNNKGLGFSPSIQLGAAYQFNKIFSASAGIRWAKQVVRAEGYVKDIEIYSDFHGGWQSPGDYLRRIADETGETTTYTLAAVVYDDIGADRYIHVKETGNGVTPIIGINISPNEKWNIGLKYESRTKTTLTTEVTDNEYGGMKYKEQIDSIVPLFEDGAKYRADLPGFISGGVSYKVTDKWQVNVGGRYMFLKNAKMDGREEHIDKNYYEIEFATEYQVAEKFLISGGYTFNKAGVNKYYHNDIDFWLPGHTIGLGGKIDIIDEFAINFGGMFTKFKTSEFNYDNHYFADNHPALDGLSPAGYEPTYDMKFEKIAYIFVVGLDFSFAKGNKKNNSTNDYSNSGNDDLPYHYRTL